jgi:hypothetical protein
MREISKYHGELTMSENELVIALNEKRFVDKSPELLKMEAAKIFNECTKRVGQIEVDSGILEVAVEDLVYAFQHELKQMTIGEIRLAIRTQSKIDKSYSISSRVIFDWINTWKATKKLELQKAISIKSKRLIAEPEKKFTKEQMLSSVQNQFKRYQEGLKVMTNTYTYLEVLGVVTSNEKKFSAIDKAIIILTDETKANKNSMVAPYVKARLKEIAECDPRKPTALVINKAQELIIMDLFKEYDEFDTSPIEMIKI